MGCAHEGLLYFCEIEQLQRGWDRYVVLFELRHGDRGSVAVIVSKPRVRNRLRHCATSRTTHWLFDAVNLRDVAHA